MSGSSNGWLLSRGWGTECGNMSGASPARAYPSTSEVGKQGGESKSQRKPSDHLQQRRANKPGPTKTPDHQASSWRCGGPKVKTGPQFVGHSQDQADPLWRQVWGHICICMLVLFACMNVYLQGINAQPCYWWTWGDGAVTASLF